ncbi:Hypothetical_protein [Hexamita inflata]|uniref:Hypothetical_protein n=1 Tax=Hexamita inflata TaxID=28002 RepID=A0AA86PJ36_9EUKA|nr:Hypothetical protein HINF_LOCUS24460 [Hexamita inflata]
MMRKNFAVIATQRNLHVKLFFEACNNFNPTIYLWFSMILYDIISNKKQMFLQPQVFEQVLKNIDLKYQFFSIRLLCNYRYSENAVKEYCVYNMTRQNRQNRRKGQVDKARQRIKVIEIEKYITNIKIKKSFFCRRYPSLLVQLFLKINSIKKFQYFYKISSLNINNKKLKMKRFIAVTITNQIDIYKFEKSPGPSGHFDFIQLITIAFNEIIQLKNIVPDNRLYKFDHKFLIKDNNLTRDPNGDLKTCPIACAEQLLNVHCIVKRRIQKDLVIDPNQYVNQAYGQLQAKLKVAQAIKNGFTIIYFDVKSAFNSLRHDQKLKRKQCRSRNTQIHFVCNKSPME